MITDDMVRQRYWTEYYPRRYLTLHGKAKKTKGDVEEMERLSYFIAHAQAPPVPGPQPPPTESPFGNNPPMLILGNPSMNPSMQIPKVLIQQWVDRFHVGTPFSEIERQFREIVARSKTPWTPAAIRQGLAYAKRRHDANMRLYARVMRGHNPLSADESDKELYSARARLDLARQYMDQGMPKYAAYHAGVAEGASDVVSRRSELESYGVMGDEQAGEAYRVAGEAIRKLNPRVYDQGAFIRVTLTADEVDAFKTRWPASGLPSRGFSFTFDAKNGDLVDYSPQVPHADQSAISALAEDAKKYAASRGKLLTNPMLPPPGILPNEARFIRERLRRPVRGARYGTIVSGKHRLVRMKPPGGPWMTQAILHPMVERARLLAQQRAGKRGKLTIGTRGREVVLGVPRRLKVAANPAGCNGRRCNHNGVPGYIWHDPRFQAELRAYKRRHGTGPVEIRKIKVPQGFPKYMSVYGRAPHAVYDAPPHSNKGKRIHHFGKRGKHQPWLVSSVERGPKFLAYVGGTFKAKPDWLYD